MAVHGLRSTGTCVSNGLLASGINLISQKFSPGDVAWTKIHNDIWWPAQVVDEKSIGAKPKKKYNDQILVRLYGSYEYLYVDLLTCNMEFENIVEQDNVTVKEAFQKSLEKELSQLLSGNNCKRKVSRYRENATAESPKGKQQKKGKTARNQKGFGSSALHSSQKQNEVSLEQEEEDDDAKDRAASNNTKQDEARIPRIKKKYSRRTSKSNSIRRPNTGNQDTTETEMDKAHGVQSTKGNCSRGWLLNTVNKDEMEKNKADQLNQQIMDKVKSEASKMLLMKRLGSGQLKLKVSEQVKVNSLGEASEEKSEKQVEYEICRDKIITPVIVKQYVLRKRKHEDVKKGLGANVRFKISQGKGKGKGKENHELRLLDSAVTVIGDRLRNRTKKNDPRSLNSSSRVPKNRDIKQDDSGKPNAMRKIDTGAASRGKNIKLTGSRMDRDAKELQKRSSNSAAEVFLRISPRKTKVMQSLGLIAPSGSPFLRSGRL